MYAIKTEGLTKYYGKTRGIERISLTVERGDFFGFMGPNGAGKSTLIRTLLGLLRPTGGRAEVLGLDVARDREKLLERVGYLPAEAAFWPGMRVRDALRLSAGLRRRDCGREARRLCERLGLDPSRKIDELSLGSRKKAAIVCALQHEPELLILDEPTGGLDPLMQREFYAVECGNILGLGGAFFASLTGVSALAKEERDHTAELLLTHPLSRAQIVTEKLAAVLAQIIAMDLALLALALVSVRLIGEAVPLREILLLHGAYWLMQTELGCVCFGVSALLRRSGAGLGMGLAAVTYLMELLANMTDRASFLKYMRPSDTATARTYW